jgi:DnaJ family protein A protein 2
MEPGDVVFVVVIKDHPSFKRDADDLILVKDIPLIDALTGASFAVRHLDGRTLRVRGKPGDVIQPGAVKMVPGGGMPKAGTGGVRFGDLLVKCNVVFPPPSALPSASHATLKALIPRVMDDRRREEPGYKAARGPGGSAAAARAGAASAAAEGGAMDVDDDEDEDDEGGDGGSRGGSMDDDDDDGAGGKKPRVEDATLVECDLGAKSAERESEARERRAREEEEDEEEGGGGRGGGVQCAQQ